MTLTVRKSLSGIAACLILTASTAAAHHSFSVQYDDTKPVTIQGLLTKVEWTNPHVYFYLDVRNQQNEVTPWAFEMVAPIVLERRGWTRNTLSIGEIIEVEGFLARDGTPLASAATLLINRTGQKYSGTTSQILQDERQ
jgi:hypothetical protein